MSHPCAVSCRCPAKLRRCHFTEPNLLKLSRGTHTHTHLCWVAGISPFAAWIIMSKHHKRWQYQATNIQPRQWVTISTNNNFMCYVLEKTNQQYPWAIQHSYGNHGQSSSIIFPGFSPSLLMRIFFCPPCLRTPEGTQLSYRVGLGPTGIPKRYPIEIIYIINDSYP